MPRVFVSQGVIDRWLDDGRAQLEGDLLRLPALEAGAPGWTLFLNPAVLFEGLQGPASDAGQLVGTVRTVQDLGAMGGEHAENTAVIGPATYTVRPGFVALLVGQDGAELQPDIATWQRLIATLAA